MICLQFFTVTFLQKVYVLRKYILITGWWDIHVLQMGYSFATDLISDVNKASLFSLAQ